MQYEMNDDIIKLNYDLLEVNTLNKDIIDEKIIVLYYPLRIILGIVLLSFIVVFFILVFNNIIVWNQLSTQQQILSLTPIIFLNILMLYSFRKKTYIYIDSFQNKYLITNNDLVNSNERQMFILSGDDYFGSNSFVNLTILLRTFNKNILITTIKELKLNSERNKIKNVTKNFRFMCINKYSVKTNSREYNLIVFNNLN